LRVRLPGYARITAPATTGIVLESCRASVESILAGESLYDFAARQPSPKQFKGRAPVYAITLGAGCGDAVVRRSVRGGALAGLHTDIFLPPTRGLRELVTSLRLRGAGVNTPEMIAFIVYRVGPIFRRSDVVTREIAGGVDLASALAHPGNAERRGEMLDAAAGLVAALSREGAHHSDLNLRNILVSDARTAESAQLQAYILDVDRIRFHFPGDPVVLSANIARLARSMRKLRDRGDLKIEDSEIEALRKRAMELAR
jgi:3-deoxy-D-manno-octulosonic acid kinase